MAVPESKYIPPTFKLSLPEDLSKDELTNFPAYKTWINALSISLNTQSKPDHPYHDNPYRLHSISVQSVDRFGGDRLGFIKFKAEVRTDDGEKFPGSVFLRGGSVAMLLVLKSDDDDEEFAILTVQARVPAGSLSFVEIPAGMIDDSGTFSGAAAKEIQEETGLEIEEGELVDMTKLAVHGDETEVLQDAVYPSCGGSDEFIPILLARKTMERKQIDELQGKLTGLREHGEKISLKIVRLRDVWKVAGRDAKALSAICLYGNLKREGKL